MPTVQEQFNLFELDPLGGVYEKSAPPVLNFENYRNGSYQNQVDKYLSENFGFREWLLRVYNQYSWSFYRKIENQQVVAGEDNWLFNEYDMNDYYGKEMYRWQESKAVAIETFDRKVRLMCRLQKLLKQDFGVDLLMFIAPTKANVFPEHLPVRSFDTATINARKYYAKAFKDRGFPIIEMTEWFLQIKDTLSFHSFPPAGDHWNFSSAIAADSLFRFMGSLKNIQLPRLTISGWREADSKYWSRDHDLEKLLNLMFRIKYREKPLKEADVTVTMDSGCIKPKVLIIGNSFIYSINDYIPLGQVFSKANFWYYNTTAQDLINGGENEAVENIDKLRAFLSADYIIWFSTASQMYNLSYGFAEEAIIRLCVSDSLMSQAIKHLADSCQITEETASTRIMENPELIPELNKDPMPSIRNTKGILRALTYRQLENDANWMNLLKVEAVNQTKQLEEILAMEVDSVLANGTLIKNTTVFDSSAFQRFEVHEIIQAWRKRDEMMALIREKTAENHRSIEEQLQLDAQWVIDNVRNKQ